MRKVVAYDWIDLEMPFLEGIAASAFNVSGHCMKLVYI